jgi:SAM-dependent methyltransferase
VTERAGDGAPDSPARDPRAFNDVAALYDEVRPSYSTETIDAIVSLTGLSPGARILEIGCGTGQITLPPAARKCRPYPNLLNTFSDHRALPEPKRTAFFQAISDTIAQCGGQVRRLYETHILSARQQ